MFLEELQDKLHETSARSTQSSNMIYNLWRKTKRSVEYNNYNSPNTNKEESTSTIRSSNHALYSQRRWRKIG